MEEVKNYKQVFIAGIGTGVGKSFFVNNMCRALNNSPDVVGIHAIKPVISGFDLNNLKASDSGVILQALSLEISMDNIDKISPFRFVNPLSPDIAAKLENLPLNYDEIIGFCKDRMAKYQNLLIEGVGGIASPIANNKLNIDLIEDLKIPVILVADNYLGTISHTITSYQFLVSRNIEVVAIIFNNISQRDDFEMVLEVIRNFVKCPIYPMFEIF